MDMLLLICIRRNGSVLSANPVLNGWKSRNAKRRSDREFESEEYGLQVSSCCYSSGSVVNCTPHAFIGTAPTKIRHRVVDVGIARMRVFLK